MRRLKGVVLGLALVGLCSAGQAWAGSPQASAVTDVALRDGGVFVGQVVDPQGRGLDGAAVSLRAGDQWVAGKAGEQGYFAFKGLRGGVYQVVAAEGRGTFRVWAPGTAPLSAQPAALLVAGQDVVRGAECNGSCPAPSGFPRAKAIVTHPLFIAGAVATAVAVPIGLSNHHEASP